MRAVCLWLLLVAFLQAAPHWYGTIPAQPYELIGYGKGESPQAARNAALAEIAGVIRSDVQSRFEQRTHLSGDQYDQSSMGSLSVLSDVQLSGVETIRHERYGQHYYTALRFDIRPFEVRLRERLGTPVCIERAGFLNMTPVGQNLKELMGCDVALRVYRQSDVWMLGTTDAALPWGQESFERLFAERYDARVVLKSSAPRLVDGEAFSLSIQAEAAGYVTLFNLYDTGQVAVMVDNLPIQGGQSLQIPESIDPGLELVAAAGNRDSTRDLYVALWHRERESFSRFEQTDSRVLGASQGSHFEELIGLLDRGVWSSVVVGVSK